MTNHAEHTHSHSDNKSKIMKVFWILLAITIVEIIWGMYISARMPKLLNAVFFLSLTFIKATYIMAEFMHLKYEVKSFILSICLPLLLFIWFIIAFCYDGKSWLGLQKKYNALPTKTASTTAPSHH